MKPTIYLALTDDWELRGDGSGDPEALQFRPMRELAAIYERHGARGTFNAEVMQQLTFRQMQAAHPELKALADAWDEHVRDVFARGHDVQLHVHPQWSDARYEGRRWRLAGDWSILNHDPGAAAAMLAAGKEYLENLLTPLDPAYRCVSFRAGALCVAPSPFILGLLARLGIELDVSLVGGLRFNTRNIKLDYTACEEGRLPFYPRMEDARRVSDRAEPVVCVPIQHLRAPRREVLRQLSSKAWQKARRKIFSPAARGGGAAADDYAQQEWADVALSSAAARVYEKAVRPLLDGKHLIADVGQLSLPLLRRLLGDLRRQAAASGLGQVPFVLTNHSKNIADFAPIERFVAEAARAGDVEFITLAGLAGKLRAGEFRVRRGAAAGAGVREV